MSMFIQYAPYKLPRHDMGRQREPFADHCFDLLNEYAPNFKQSVLARQVLTPLDLERTFGFDGGKHLQGAMPIHQLFFARPVPGFADYRTPIRGLYLCGAAAHPAEVSWGRRRGMRLARCCASGNANPRREQGPLLAPRASVP